MKNNNEIKYLINDKNTQIKLLNNKHYNFKDIKSLNQIRNSSFEILRIILMFLIILSHIKYHTKSLPHLKNNNYHKLINNKYILLRIISNYGKFGDIVFIMISGYFSLKRIKFHYIKFILIASETYTYHYLLLYISNKLKYIYKDIKYFETDKISQYFPLISSTGHWFTQHYLLILIFMPFINTGLLNLTHKQYKILVILILIFYCLIKAFINICNISSKLFSVTQFLKLLMPYIIGGYIRIYDSKYLLFWKISGILFFILTIIFEILFDNLAIKYNEFLWIIIQNELSLQLYSIFPILSSIGIICLFKDFKIYNKIINFISASVLGIYLIHANKNIAPFIYNSIFKTNDYIGEYFFFKYFLKAIIIFVLCLLIDIIRRFTIGFFIEIILKKIKFFTIFLYT